MSAVGLGQNVRESIVVRLFNYGKCNILLSSETYSRVLDGDRGGDGVEAGRRMGGGGRRREKGEKGRREGGRTWFGYGRCQQKG